MIAYNRRTLDLVEPTMSDAERIEQLEGQVRALLARVAELEQKDRTFDANMRTYVSDYMTQLVPGIIRDTRKHDVSIVDQAQALLGPIITAEIERRRPRTAAEWLLEYERRQADTPKLTLRAFSKAVGVRYEALLKARQRAKQAQESGKGDQDTIETSSI